MPYFVLDAYIDAFIHWNMSPKELFLYAKQHLNDYYHRDEDIIRDIRKFVTMAARAQWKRVRFANSFQVMPYDLAPNSGLQWPCLMDGFSKSLSEL